MFPHSCSSVSRMPHLESTRRLTVFHVVAYRGAQVRSNLALHLCLLEIFSKFNVMIIMDTLQSTKMHQVDIVRDAHLYPSLPIEKLKLQLLDLHCNECHRMPKCTTLPEATTLTAAPHYSTSET